MNNIIFIIGHPVTLSLILDMYSRRSRIFPKGRLLSCEVPSRRDSVGGGVVAEFFRGLRKPTRFSGGGVVAEGGVVPSMFRKWGPFTFLIFSPPP